MAQVTCKTCQKSDPIKGDTKNVKCIFKNSIKNATELRSCTEHRQHFK